MDEPTFQFDGDTIETISTGSEDRQSAVDLSGFGIDANGEPLQRKRGRPKGSKNRSRTAGNGTEEGIAAFAVSTPEKVTRARSKELLTEKLGVALANAFANTFALTAKFRGPHWLLDNDSALAMGVSWGQVLSHLPHSKKFALWIDIGTAATITTAVMGSRIADDIAITRSRKNIDHNPPEDERSSVFFRQNGHGQNYVDSSDLIDSEPLGST